MLDPVIRDLWNYLDDLDRLEREAEEEAELAGEEDSALFEELSDWEEVS